LLAYFPNISRLNLNHVITLKSPLNVRVMMYTLNVYLELLQSHIKVQPHDDLSVANALISPAALGGTYLYLRILCG